MVILVALIAAAIVVVQGAPGLFGRGARPGTASPTPTVGQSGPSESPVPTLASPSTIAVGRSAVFDPTRVKDPSGPSSQSKVWFAFGSWWGLLRTFGSELHVERLDWGSSTWTDTGTLVDERPSALADALWDGTHLYVVSSPGATDRVHGIRLLRFTFQPAEGRFSLDPDFPLTLSDSGVDDLVITQDSTGTLWVTFRAPSAPGLSPSGASPSASPSGSPPATPLTGASEAIWALHSTADDLHWALPALLDLGASANQATQLAATWSGAEMALAWTSRTDDALFTARHVDGAPAASWTVARTPIDGAAGSDQGLSLRAMSDDPARRLFVGLVTALDRRPDVNPLWPRTLLVVVSPDGSAQSHEFGLVQDHHVDPLVVIDPVHRWLYMWAGAPAHGGAIYLKSSSLDAISFVPGLGEPFVSSPSDPTVGAPSIGKQVPTAASGILVLASDNGTGHYLEGAMDLGGLIPGRGPTLVSPSPSPPVENVLLDDTFDPWTVGRPVPNGWILQSGSAGRLVVVALPSDTDRSAFLETIDAQQRARACKSVPPVSGTHFTGSAMVEITGQGIGAATPFALRGGGRQIAALIFGGHGTMGYVAGSATVTTSVGYRPGAWYRITITVDLSAHTYDLRVEARGSHSLLLGERGLALASSQVTSVSGVCFGTSSGAAGLGLAVAAVSLTRP